MTNDKPKDVLTVPFEIHTCDWSGKVQRVEITDKGRFTVVAKPDFRIAEPCLGPGQAQCEEEDPENPFCYAETAKLTGTIALPEFFSLFVTGTAKLNRKTNLRGCPKGSSIEVEAILTGFLASHVLYVEST